MLGSLLKSTGFVHLNQYMIYPFKVEYVLLVESICNWQKLPEWNGSEEDCIFEESAGELDLLEWKPETESRKAE